VTDVLLLIDLQDGFTTLSFDEPAAIRQTAVELRDLGIFPVRKPCQHLLWAA